MSLGDPSVAQVSGAWDRVAGRPLDGDTVLVTASADLLATVLVHPFIAWKSIYSHPAGRFAERLALGEGRAMLGLPVCRGPAARQRLRPGGRLVLNTLPGGVGLTVAVDTFPNSWVLRRVTFSRDLFRAPYFAVRWVGTVSVIAVR